MNEQDYDNRDVVFQRSLTKEDEYDDSYEKEYELRENIIKCYFELKNYAKIEAVHVMDHSSV